MTRLPFIISLPHSSGRVPTSLGKAFSLNEEEIMESVDIGVKDIFGSLPAMVLVEAVWSRLVVDLNRAPDAQGPMGLIPRKDYYGRAVYHGSHGPDRRDRDHRLGQYYLPFHKQLTDALDRSDIIGLFDCHSLNGVGPSEAPDAGKKRKDIILGNNGDKQGLLHPTLGRTTCPAETMEFMRDVFIKKGFSVALNDPYSGGFISTHYGQACVETGRFAVQIEINQGLFLEPEGKEIDSGKLDDVKAGIFKSFEQIARLGEKWQSI